MDKIQLGMNTKEINKKTEEIAKSMLQKNFLIGRNWDGVPIRQDILKYSAWIYNTEIEENVLLDGIKISFIKFHNIPDQIVASSIEWRTIDCLSFSRLCSCIPYSEAEIDLIRAVKNGKLDINLLELYANEYGDGEVIKTVKKARKTFERFCNHKIKKVICS